MSITTVATTASTIKPRTEITIPWNILGRDKKQYSAPWAAKVNIIGNGYMNFDFIKNAYNYRGNVFMFQVENTPSLIAVGQKDKSTNPIGNQSRIVYYLVTEGSTEVVSRLEAASKLTEAQAAAGQKHAQKKLAEKKAIAEEKKTIEEIKTAAQTIKAKQSQAVVEKVPEPKAPEKTLDDIIEFFQREIDILKKKITELEAAQNPVKEESKPSTSSTRYINELINGDETWSTCNDWYKTFHGSGTTIQKRQAEGQYVAYTPDLNSGMAC